MSVLSDVLYQATDLQSVYLVVMSAFRTVKFWTYEEEPFEVLDNFYNSVTDNSGNIVVTNSSEYAWLYWTPFPFDGNAYVTGAQCNGSPMIQVATRDECSTTLNSFFWDRVDFYVSPPEGFDPQTSWNT